MPKDPSGMLTLTGWSAFLGMPAVDLSSAVHGLI